MGIKAKFEGLDVDALVSWKAGIVNKLTSGVGGLLKNHKVDVFMGDAKVTGKNRVEVTSKDGKQTVETKNIVVASGSTPISVPGFDFDGKAVWSSTDALAPKSLPKRMIVIGGGYIGLELGLVYHKLGTEVRVLEFMDRVLPGMEADLSKEMGRSLKKKKVPVHLNTKATGYKKGKGGLTVTAEVNGKERRSSATSCCRVSGASRTARASASKAIGVNVERPRLRRRRPPPPDQRARHLRDRRRRRSADARAQGLARGPRSPPAPSPATRVPPTTRPASRR